jgi:formate dehydrogenase major subunit
VEVDGKLTRACGTAISGAMTVLTKSAAADRAQREAFDRILGHHLLYCTVCDNNNGNCTVHNTTALLKVEHQNIPFKIRKEIRRELAVATDMLESIGRSLAPQRDAGH